MATTKTTDAAATGKRRPQGDGGITLRSDGRWQAQIDLGIVDGKRVRKFVYGKTRKAVADKLRDALARKAKGALVTGPRQTFGQFLDRWLTDIVTPKCRPKTIDSYGALIRLHIKPALGHVALSKLAARDLQTFYAQKRAARLSDRTIVYLHAVVRASLKHAERSGEIGYSPANRVAAPTSTRPDIKPFTIDEAGRLLSVAATDRLAALWTLALHTGLRQGELLGLRWVDVDLERGTLVVLQTTQVIAGKIVFGAPKSKGSRRTVPIAESALAALKAWRARQLEERLKAGPLWTDSGPVFTSHAGTPLFARNVSRRWHELLSAAKIDPRGMHAARHTTATLLMAAGEHPKVVQELLGHATIALTLDTYSHVMEGQREQATAKLSALLSPQVAVSEASGRR